MCEPEQELKNIIDKLAQFVARNGPEFEQMTKNKQKDNPKFGFLFGGEHFNYYQYKVTTEQAILKQKEVRDTTMNQAPSHMISSPAPPMGLPPQSNIPVHNQTQQSLSAHPPQWMVVPPTPSVSLDTLVVQQQQLQEQIRQSEQNLAAQHQVLMQQQQTQIEEALRQAQEDSLQQKADEGGVSFSELDQVLQPIIDSCTKDSISAGKGWIFGRSSNSHSNEVVAQYLLKKAINPGSPFTQKLHLIYLVNDVLHHCVRKNAEDLKKALESVAVPMFCNATLGVSEEQQSKLNKVE